MTVGMMVQLSFNSSLRAARPPLVSTSLSSFFTKAALSKAIPEVGERKLCHARCR